MQVVMMVNTGRLLETKIVKVAEPVDLKQDWVRTNKGVYIQRDWVRRLNGSPV